MIQYGNESAYHIQFLTLKLHLTIFALNMYEGRFLVVER